MSVRPVGRTIGSEQVDKRFADDLRILLSVDDKKFSEIISRMEKDPKNQPPPKTFEEILGFNPKDARSAGAVFLWLLYNFSMETISAEDISNFAQSIGESREKAQQLCFAMQKMSQALHDICRRRGILRYISAYRVVPHFHSFGHTFNFRPVSPKGKTVAIVPLVTLNFVALNEGDEQQKELILEMNVIELNRLRKNINEIAEQLDLETARLSQKLGNIVISSESALELGERW